MLYFYSAHWKTWNRVLLENFNGQFIELNISHVFGAWEGALEQSIRVHDVQRSPRDRVQSTLPLDVKQAMTSTLGAFLANRLTTYDYLPEIDWAKYEKCLRINGVYKNGGIPFDKIRREE